MKTIKIDYLLEEVMKSSKEVRDNRDFVQSYTLEFAGLNFEEATKEKLKESVLRYLKYLTEEKSFCPICGSESLVEMKGSYLMSPPPNIHGGQIIVDGTIWEKCFNCGEEIIPPKLNESIEKIVNKRRHGIFDNKKDRTICSQRNGSNY